MSVAVSGGSSSGIVIAGPLPERADEILTPEALAFVAHLEHAFGRRRRDLLSLRKARQARFDAGELPDFLKETAAIRAGNWKVAPIPADLLDRRVEITGPVDRKMIVNALNSGAKVFMADFEDASSPTFANMVNGQINLRDRWQNRIDFVDPGTLKSYALNDQVASLIVRPRGWHLDEAHATLDGQPVSGALWDFGLYVFHNARAAIAAGSGPYFYLPKLESCLEARLWNDVFVEAQNLLSLPVCTIKATVLIETLPAAFEMDEILYELRDHIVGLNCGRWDYIFSFIKTLRAHKAYVLPDRSQVIMGKWFLKAYSDLLIKTCHHRGAFAMGGMAAQIPIKGNPEKNAAAFAKVEADKMREAAAGHDGTWVAHPDLVPVAMAVFNELMPTPNQLDKARDDVVVGRDDLLTIHEGSRSEVGLRENIRVGIRYIAAWLEGRGAVPIYDLMEDAATAEISRTQIWQWLHYGASLDDGSIVTQALVEKAIAEEAARVREEVGPAVFDGGRYREATNLFKKLILEKELAAFLTLSAYRLLG
ncbi:MAG: malate synthase A [Ancalomicrobiaceae bacterium]|nr:malate synthase A [Ancalomicrobiaceae bacterium]